LVFVSKFNHKSSSSFLFMGEGTPHKHKFFQIVAPVFLTKAKDLEKDLLDIGSVVKYYLYCTEMAGDLQSTYRLVDWDATGGIGAVANSYGLGRITSSTISKKGLCYLTLLHKHSGAVVGIATGYGLDGPRGRSSSSGWVKNFLHVQIGSGFHPASYPLGTGDKARS
jgi:hypothetical protein